jgi:hypothetical protein
MPKNLAPPTLPKLPKNSRFPAIAGPMPTPMPSLGTAAKPHGGGKSGKIKAISPKPTTKAPKHKSTRPGHW